MILNDKTYDFLKWLAIYFLPSIATFTGVCGIALQWEYTTIAVTIINGLGACIAGCIGISTREYRKALEEQYESEDYD